MRNKGFAPIFIIIAVVVSATIAGGGTYAAVKYSDLKKEKEEIKTELEELQKEDEESFDTMEGGVEEKEEMITEDEVTEEDNKPIPQTQIHTPTNNTVETKTTKQNAELLATLNLCVSKYNNEKDDVASLRIENASLVGELNNVDDLDSSKIKSYINDAKDQIKIVDKALDSMYDTADSIENSCSSLISLINTNNSYNADASYLSIQKKEVEYKEKESTYIKQTQLRDSDIRDITVGINSIIDNVNDEAEEILEQIEEIDRQMIELNKQYLEDYERESKNPRGMWAQALESHLANIYNDYILDYQKLENERDSLVLEYNSL